MRLPTHRSWPTFSLVVMLALGLLGGDTFGGGSIPEQAARGYRFNIYTWHVENFPARWPHTMRQALWPAAPAEGVPDIRAYFAAADQPAREPLKYGAERAVEDLITHELIEEGLTRRALVTDVVWPPVYVRLSDMPPILVVSPRDRIHVQETHLLTPGMTDADILALERSIDERGLSSLVLEIGGVATYPSLLPENMQLKQLLDTAAHEWVHHYLFFRPLGQKYWANGDMTAINETVADLVGRELGARLWEEYFTEPISPSGQGEAGPKALRASSPPPATGPAFDFNTFMRETRLAADRLLAEGKLTEAEGHMEQRRLNLASHGYHIRKLNQAYFAFHGNYAERGPGAVSPVGGYVRKVRLESTSLKAFLERVAQYTTLEALRRDAEGVA